MDKHMIHIDDLVRQKLGGAEEEERPGAWLQMRELLDKQMPSKIPPAAFNWRRLYSAAAGLLLLASAGGGGYALYHSSFSSNLNTAGGRSNSVLHSGAGNDKNSDFSGSRTATVPQPSDEGTIVTVYNREGSTTEEVVVTPGQITGADKVGTPGLHSSVSDRSIHSGEFASDDANNRNTDRSDRIGPLASKKSEYQLKKTSPSLPISVPVANNSLSEADATPDVSYMSRPSDASVISGNQQQKPILASASKASANSKKVNILNSKAANQSSRNNTGTTNRPNAGSQPSSALIPASSNTQRKVAQQIDSQRFTLVHDTFQKITMRKRYLINQLTRTGSYITDTLAVERVAIDKWMPKEDSDPILAAAFKKDSKTANGLVPLSSLKVVKSRKTSKWDAQQFKDIVRDAKFNMSQIRFYPGITGGINASLLGPGGLTGFQVGMTSLFTFGDNWSASAEAKYFQRFNGKTIDDNYYSFGSAAGNPYRKTVEHNFKFSNMQSLELPITLRYTMGRFSALTGVNLVYNLRINAEEFERMYDSTGVMITPQYVIANNKPVVGISDFNARFTGGYVLGLNYQVTPALGLDMRMTQNVWNGMKGAGAEKVYDHLYRSPSFQISIGYRFSNNPRYPKAR